MDPDGFDGYDMEGCYADDPRRPIETHGCYVTSASYKDPANAVHHAPAGVTNVEVMTVVPASLARFGVSAAEVATWEYRKHDVYEATKARLEADMIARLERLFPGAAARVVFRESATPVSHVRYTQPTDGTGYGLAATPEQFFAGRPGYRGPLPGLCGASTRAGHGIVGAMTSGRAAAAKISRDRARAMATSGHPQGRRR